MAEVAKKDKDQTLTVAPVLPLRDIVVFPHMIVPLFVGREKSVRALEEVMSEEKQILLLTQKNAAEDDPNADGLHTIGTVATVLQLLRLPDQTVRVLVEGKSRARVTGFTGRTEFEGIEEDLHLMVGRAERLRGAYRKRLDLHRDSIMEAARRIDFTFAVHRTDRAPHTALLALYGALSGEIDARRAPRPGG